MKSFFTFSTCNAEQKKRKVHFTTPTLFSNKAIFNLKIIADPQTITFKNTTHIISLSMDAFSRITSH